MLMAMTRHSNRPVRLLYDSKGRKTGRCVK
jgi:hypothetical protein